MISVKGIIDHIIFRNPDNGYTVLKLITDEGNITLTGLLSYVSEGDTITAQGDFTFHKGYGEQFSVSGFTVEEPDSKDQILKYLSSGAVKGIGPTLALRIVEKFGDKTFEIMGREPERLSEVKGISLNKAMDISASFEEKAGIRKAMIYLQQQGIGNNLALKIYEKYGEGVYNVISENPYRLIEDIQGVGFKTADEIALRSGVGRHSRDRIDAGIIHSLFLSMGEGHTCLPENVLIRGAAELLELKEDEVRESITPLVMDRKIVIKPFGNERFVYLRHLYLMEEESAFLLKGLNISYGTDSKELERDIRELEETENMELDPVQREAVISAAENGVFIMTGGPGTGKTTTIRILLKYFLSKAMDVSLAAPTGRAAKRLSEAAMMEAKTIHRLLEVSGTPGDLPSGLEVRGFGRNKENPLETDVVIVDEMSMVDIILFNSLLRAVPAGTRLIMVGDEHQLPSVGPGSVLKDLLLSERFKSLSLNKIFRQAEESDIVMNAHALLNNREMKLNNKSSDFFFLNRNDPGEITQGIVYLVREKLPPYVGVTSDEIQVLTPMRKGVLGVESLNRVLQEALNPPSVHKKELNRGDHVIRAGDRVMQNRNNYQMEWDMTIPGEVLRVSGRGVFNGDMGTVEGIDTENRSLFVVFEDGRKARYEAKDLADLELAYAITIHKSQGSEYPAVIMPLLSGPDKLMNSNLLYTGITRAKKCVVIIGSGNTVKRMEENKHEQERYTGFIREIQKYVI